MQDGDEIVVLGSIPSLGNWQSEGAAVLTETNTPHWEKQVIHQLP